MDLTSKTQIISMKIYLIRSLGSLLLLVGMIAGSNLVFATGNAELVGILASISDPANAAQLGLSQDQLDRMDAIIKQHESQALNFASQLRELSPSDRRKKEFEQIRAVEKQGMAILSDAQKVTAESWRLQKLGMSALVEDDFATVIGLDDAQIAKVKNILEGRSALLREMGRSPGGKEKVAAELNQRIDAVLNDEQRSTWVRLAGIANEDPNSQVHSASTTSEPSSSESSPSDENGPTTTTGNAVSGNVDGIMLNFNATPWSEVLKWLAKEAELSLQVDAYPTGSFTYRDPYRRYSVAEAMDIMNSVLLGKGFTLVKRQRILMSVDLSVGDSAELVRAYIREMAELVDAKDLDRRGDYELVKCVFTLERTNVEEIEKEVKLLIGAQGSVVALATASQVLVAETAGKLRIIRELIERSENPDGARSAKIVTLPLKYVSADEVLAVSRPLLGLKDGINTSEELSVSTDTFGNTIYATGTPDKLQKLRDLTLQIDVKPANDGVASATAEQSYFKSHPLLGSDPMTSMDVLQSTFSGQPGMRLAMDPKTNNILASATKTDHDTIDKILTELAGQSSGFEVIALNKLDTQAAILTLEKFFGKQSKDKDPTTSKGPIFYGDSASRRIMVKGTEQEVAQVRSLLTKVQDSGPAKESISDGMILMPYTGKTADRMLNQIDVLMQATKRKSRIKEVWPKNAKKPMPRETPFVIPPTGEESVRDKSESEPSDLSETTDKEPAIPRKRSEDVTSKGTINSFAKFAAAKEDTQPTRKVSKPKDAPKSSSETGSQNPETKSGEITVFRGPNGLVITSDDQQALKEFNEIAEMAEKQMAAGPSAPEVIYLQHIKAVAAAELIRSIIAGEVASNGGGGGVLGDVASSVLGGGGIFGSLFGGGNSASSSGGASVSGTGSTGEISLVPDPRFNALWVQANPLDMQLVEDLVETIDRPDGPVENQSRGVAQTIYVLNTSVTDVEATIKQVFADRIAQPASAAAQRQPSPQDFIEALRGGGGGGGGRRSGGNGQSELKESTMTITADKKNNSLIVVATPQLFGEVEKLVRQMDEDAGSVDESVVVVPIGGEVNSSIMKSALESVFGSSAKTANATAQPSNAAPAANASANNPGQNNPDPFQQFRNRGGAGFQGGGFPGGFPGGGFPGFPGGGRGFGGGGFPGFGGGFPGLGGGNRGGNQGGGNQGGGGRNRN
jgi:type II secretory pathway component GspD/PulD (secretin)